jgi:hypothetical protein
MRNRGYIEFKSLEKQCWSYLMNIKTAINYFFYKRFTHKLPTFLTGKIWLNIGICQTLKFSSLKIIDNNLVRMLMLQVNKMIYFVYFIRAESKNYLISHLASIQVNIVYSGALWYTQNHTNISITYSNMHGNPKTHN